MISNKNLNPVVIDLFNRERKLNISTVFITQSYFQVANYVKLNWTHFFYYQNSKQTRVSINCI